MPGRILPCMCWVWIVAGVLALCQAVPADIPSQTHGWKFDVVHLHTGRKFRGLVLEETPGTVKFQCIWQELGVTTLDELKAAAEGERLRALPGLGAKSEEKILKALAFKAENPDEGRRLLGEGLPAVLAGMAPRARGAADRDMRPDDGLPCVGRRGQSAAEVIGHRVEEVLGAAVQADDQDRRF